MLFCTGIVTSLIINRLRTISSTILIGLETVSPDRIILIGIPSTVKPFRRDTPKRIVAPVIRTSLLLRTVIWVSLARRIGTKPNNTRLDNAASS